jgi:SAM-dependent methyltransferase
MSYAQCNICGSEEARLVKKEDAWDILECKNCSFVYVVPLPTDEFLHLHYQEYLSRESSHIVQWQTMMLNVFRKSLDAIEARCRRQRGVLLDIGCGYGFFLEMARQNGWRVYGLEPCAHARAYAAAKALEVDGCSFFDRAYKDEMFDVVTLFYVLEHLPRPLSYLKEINRILKPEGLLLVRVPHTTPLVKILKIFNIPNRLYDAPSHLSDFSPRTIAIALDKTGFGEIHTFPGGATRPHALGQRIISRSSGFLADILYTTSGRRLLLPGVSKTTIATKMRHGDV